VGFPRASDPPRRAAVVVLLVLSLVLGASVGHAIVVASASTPARSPVAAVAPITTRRARVLLIGDSILDQQGSAAAFLLRQAGVDARAIGLWGSGLLTIDQYDYGKTKLGGQWLHRAKTEIARFDPDAVGVYLNHNYWPPFPHDASGRKITDLWSPPGQQMIARQARALVRILRARGAKVFFISPVPAGTISNPDPVAWNPIWHGYQPALRAMRVPVADSAGPLEGPDGLRTETKPACNGTPHRVRPARDLHLTRFGAGRAGTALAGYVATLVHAQLRGNAAPSEPATALVPTRDGRGYWLVACDGSVYHFGHATQLAGARGAIAGHGGVVAAVASPTPAGLWLVAADGTLARVGDAPPLAFANRHGAPIVDATATPGALGLWATTASGIVLHAGTAPTEGDLAHTRRAADVVGITSTPDGLGYWLVTSRGQVFAFGTARFYGAAPGAKASPHPITGLAPTPDGRGYWLAADDGAIYAFGTARAHGDAEWPSLPYPYNRVTATPGPGAGIVSFPGPGQGYWVFDTTGRVVSRGAAGHYGGDNNLAMLTQ
jgi:hypothetical protein